MPLRLALGCARAALAAVFLLVGGCKLYMAGHSADHGIVVTGIGDFDMNTKTMPFEITYDGLGITCTGTSSERLDGVKGLTGGFTCSDGRTGTGKSRLVGMDNGTGYFTDSCGNSFQYIWGMSDEAMQTEAGRLRALRGASDRRMADKCKLAKTEPASPPTIDKSAPPGFEQLGDEGQRLAKLKKMLDLGLITDSDYAAQKRAILHSMLPATGAEGKDGGAPAPSAPADVSAIPDVDFGEYYALVIGNNNYLHLPKLRTAQNDARAVAQELKDDYGFHVTLLLDASRAQIIDQLDRLTEALGRRDNLLIYYAGHGALDENTDRGYWLPVDAAPNRRTNWVSNTTLTDTLRALQAKHVMIVADSCFSGALARDVNVGVRAGDYWRRMASKQARVALLSGGLEPVADGSGPHSPFASALLQTLRANRTVMDGTQLFEQIRRPVMTAAKQTPEYADVRQAGHDGGDFLFVRKR